MATVLGRPVTVQSVVDESAGSVVGRRSAGPGLLVPPPSSALSAATAEEEEEEEEEDRDAGREDGGKGREGRGREGVEAVGGRGRRAAGGGAVLVTALMSGLDPAEAAATAAGVAAAAGALTAQVAQALSAGPVTALPATLGAGAGAFACAGGRALSPATEACCPASALPAAGAGAGAAARVAWTGSCSWQCLPPYVLSRGACLTCNERNVGGRLPANATWDDSGASADCSAWQCNAGLLPRADGSACLPYAALRQATPVPLDVWICV